MPLILPTPSTLTKKAFRTGLAEMIKLGRAPGNLPKENFPQRIYTVTLNDVVRGRGVENAKPLVWEFLVGGGDVPAVLAVIADPRGKQPPRLTSLVREPIAGEAHKATRRVEKLPAVARHRYELRRLRIPALSLGAFWLKSLERSRADLAVPYEAIHEKLRSMHAYPMDEYLSVVRAIAEKRIAAETALRRNKPKAGPADRPKAVATGRTVATLASTPVPGLVSTPRPRVRKE